MKIKKTKNKTKIYVKGTKKGTPRPNIKNIGHETRITSANAHEYIERAKLARKEGKFFKACILENLEKPLKVELEDGTKLEGKGIDVITRMAFIQSGNGDPHARKWVAEYVEGKPEQPIEHKGEVGVTDKTLTNLSDEALSKLIEKL